MKVMHIESGLGNQMLDYAEFLVIQKNHPDEDCYIETLVYDIPECNEVIRQWYGYELERIFGIRERNVSELFTRDQWERVVSHVRESEFWNKNWNYPEPIIAALNSEGLQLQNYRGTVGFVNLNESFLRKITKNRFGYFIKRILRPFYQERYIQSLSLKDRIFIKSDKDLFSGHFLGLNQVNSGIEFIENEIRDTFRFSPITDEQNLKLLQELHSCNSVSIHARRGDALGTNGFCYKYGYFKRATRYIKKHVKDPVFYFFSDPGSVKWCQENIRIFGLDPKRDQIHFVDWNEGEESYRDMQLMAQCKHNIITFSSFGWWASYLNENPDKITISPNVWLNTTVTL